MNRRIFFFGLGVGVIIGAALLQLMLIGEKQADALGGNDAATKMFTQAELDKAVAEAREKTDAELAKTTEEAKPAADPAAAIPTADPASAKPTAKPEQAAAKPAGTGGAKTEAKPEGKSESNAAEAGEKPSRIIVRIPPNAGVSETADLLADRGVISDKKAFLDLMRKRTIRAGYFDFQGKLSLRQVSAIITGKPLDPETAQKEIAAGSG